MAWNGSDAKKVEVKGGERKDRFRSSTSTSNFNYKALTAGLIVVILGGAIAWWMFGRQEAPRSGQSDDVASKRIKAVEPAKAPVAKAEVTKAVAKRPPQRVGEVRDGYRLLPNGRLHKVVGVITTEVTRVSLAEKTFDTPTDVAIAELLTIEPGTSMLGESTDYYQDFNRTFLKSLETPIIITKDDDEEVRLLKEAVIDTRKELKQKLDAGEDLTAIMRESRDQMRELSLYREDLEKEVVRVAKEKGDFSKADLEELVAAANTMLKERGVKPLYMNGTLGHQLRMLKLNAKKESQNE